MIPNQSQINTIKNHSIDRQRPVESVITEPAKPQNFQLSKLSTPQKLKIHVESLCKIPRNSLNHTGMQAAIDYIKSAWCEIGLGDRIEEQSFVANRLNPEKKESKNIIVSLGPKDAERIIIGAHYDTCAQDDPQIISNPGADDNASAVAGLLETGRSLKSIESELYKKNIRVDLVAYANEEPPFFSLW